MLLLTGVSDKIQIVTLAAVTIDVHVSFVDKTGTTVTPGRKNTAITTATTTDICESPPAGTERNVQTIQIRNKDVSGCNIVVQHTDGITVSEMIGVNLADGWEAEYVDGHGWKVIDNTGMILSGSVVAGGGDIAIRGSGTYVQSTGTVQFQNSNGLTFGLTGGAMTASHNGLTIQSVQPGIQSLSGGTTRITTGEIVFSNSNGISAGINGQTVTFAHNGLTTAAQSDHSHGVTLNLTNLAGTTGGGSAGIILSLSATAQSVQPGIQSISGGTTRVTTGEVVFSNSNGISAGVNGQTVTFSHNGLTTAAQSDHTHGAPNFFGTNISGTFNSLSNALSISLSVNPPGAGGGVAISGGTQLATSGTVNFANSNGVTFGMSGSSQITASHNGLTTAAQSDHTHGAGNIFLTNFSATINSVSSNWSLSLSAAPPGGGGGPALSAGTQSVNTGTVNFANSNGITFGMSLSSQVTASHNGLTSQSTAPSAVIASNATFTSGSIWFTGSNQVTVRSGAAGSVVIDASAIALSASGSLYGSGTVILTGSNNVTVSVNGQTVIVSGPNTHAQQTGISGIAGSAASTVTAGTVQFSNLNGISFGLNGSTMTASHNALTSQSNQAFSASGGSSAFQTIEFQASNGITFSNNAGSVRVTHDLQHTSNTSNIITGRAGLGTTFAGANISASMTLNTAGLNMSASVAAPGAGGGIAIQDSALTITSGTAYFSNGGNVSFGIAGQTITASAPGGGAAVTKNFFAPYDEAVNVAGQHGQGTLIIRPDVYPNVAFDRLCFRVNQSAQTGQTGTATLSIGFGLYTKNASTLSLYASRTGTLTVPYSGTASNATYAGPKLATIGWTTTITEGVYWVAIASSTATAGGNCSISQFLKSQMNSSFSGVWGVASNATAQRMLGQGRYTAAVLTPPNSIGFTQIQGNSSLFHRPPIYFMISGTV